VPARSRALPLAQSGQRHAAGFAFVALDLEGLHSGSLNRLLPTRAADS